MTHYPKIGLNASIFREIEISRILHNSFAITWENSGSHNFSDNTNYQLICTERNLYNTQSQKCCENDQDNWDQYINQVLTRYCVTPHLTTAESTPFLVYGRNPNLPLHQLYIYIYIYIYICIYIYMYIYIYVTR